MRKGKQEMNVFGVIVPTMIDASVWIYSIFVAAKQVFNKSVSSSSPCSLSTEALLNLTTLQFTPWPLCLNMMMWLHLSHCLETINICFSFNCPGYAHYGELLAEGWGRLWGKWKIQLHSEVSLSLSLYFNLFFLLVMKGKLLIIHALGANGEQEE